nr:hypothetical protein [Tanacetum cinerariifolium]
MVRLQLCDYHNMVAILERSEHNIDFHSIVDFVEASPLKYTLTFKPTVYVSHIRQFWSTARIETTEEGTKILATVDGILRTITESYLRRNLKLKDEEGIRSLPDAELFENLTQSDAASQEVKKDVSSLRYIALPNWVYDAFLKSSLSKPQDDCSTDVPDSSGNSNPTVTSTNPSADQTETLTMETPIPTISSPVPTACFTNSQEPSRVRPIRIKWVLKNKKDERGIVIKNKARLVAQGHTHEEGIDYDKVFAPVARIEAIRLFLAYASFMGFTDPEFLARVYKVEKATYGLHQAPRAWYGTLSKYFLTNGFQRGTSKYWGVLRILMISLRLILLSEHNIDFHPIVDFFKASPLRIETTKEGNKILATVDGLLRIVTESSLRRNLKLKDKEGICSLLDTKLFENLTLMDEHTSPLRDVSQGEACPTVSSLDAEQDRANIAKTSTLPYESTSRSDLVFKFKAQEMEINRLKARVKLLEDRKGGVAERSRDDAPIKGKSLDEGEEIAKKGSNDNEEMINVLTSMDAATVLSSRVAEVPTSSGSIPTASPPDVRVPTGSDIVPTATPIFATDTMVTPYTRRKGKEKMMESETPKKKKIQKQMDIQMAKQLEEEMEREAQRMNKQIARDAKIARIHTEEELQMLIDGLDRNNETVAKYLQEYDQFAAELPFERRIELISNLVKYQDNYTKVHKYQTHQRKPLTKKHQREFYTSVLRNQAGWKAKDFKGMTLEEIKENFDPESVKKLKTSKEVKAAEEVPEETLKEMMQLVPVEEITRLGGSSASYQFLVDMLKHLDREDLNQLWRLVKESLSIRPPTSNKEMEL